MNKRTRWFFIGILALILSSGFIWALPAGPQINYIGNSTAASVSANRTQDEKGTITVVTLDSNQQDYKWKAYVGNVSGKLALDGGDTYTIYDWALGTPTGEVYVTRSSSITWADIACANDTVISDEESALGMAGASTDSINNTFAYTAHESFLVGTKNITNSTCKSTATYIDDIPQTVDETASFQEVLLSDPTGSLVYTTMIENDQYGYNNQTYDFQLLVAENESSTTPTLYYFFVELG